MSAPRDLMEQYRAAFAGADIHALADCFAFPLQVLTVTGEVGSVAVWGEQEWTGVLETLLASYRRLGVADCVPLAIEISEPMPALAVVRLQWALQRADGGPVYDFTAVYTLARAGGRLRIVAIAHDEMPKLQAALG